MSLSNVTRMQFRDTELPSPSDSDRSDRLGYSVRIGVVFCLAVAVAVATWIVALQQRAQTARSAEVLIARLHGETNWMNALEMAAMAGDNTAEQADTEADACAARTAELIQRLNTLAPEASVHTLESSVARYEHAVRPAIDRFLQGDRAGGLKIDSETIDPLEVEVDQEVKAADRELSQVAASAAIEADTGTVFCLLAGALTLAACFVGLTKNVQRSTRLHHRQAALEESEQRWSSLIQNVSDIIAVADPTGALCFVSPAMKSMLGFESEQVIGRPVYELAHAEDSVVARRVTEQAGQATYPVNQEWRMVDANGDAHACEVTLTNLTADPHVRGILLTFRDVSDRKRFEAQLLHQAFHDTLTGLPNRALLQERLQRALERGKRDGKATGLLFLDLDNFKVVNDSLGHQEGDRLLVELAARLEATVRATDTVARLGGDEFMVLLDEVKDADELTLVADKVLRRLRKAVNLQGRDIVPSGSIGIAVSTATATWESLIRDADTAMYHAKTSGKGSFAVFEPSMSERAMERLELEGDLREAISGGQMFLAYQPICALSPVRVCGVEALVRWQHPSRGVVSPASFIPIAEDTGLIVPLGYWVLETACWEVREWIAAGQTPQPFTLNVNVSALQLLEPDFVPQVLDILERTRFVPSELKLEITESMVMENLEACVGKMNELRAIGIHVAIDDFGTGYSSMAQLSLLPVDTLKIDRAFVNRIGKDDDNTIISAIIGMAQSMGLQITSEGIETAEQLALLESLGCGQGQGFLFAKPMRSELMPEFLASDLAASKQAEAA